MAQRKTTLGVITLSTITAGFLVTFICEGLQGPRPFEEDAIKGPRRKPVPMEASLPVSRSPARPPTSLPQAETSSPLLAEPREQVQKRSQFKQVKIGFRIDSKAGVQFFGIDDLNEQIREGGRVLSIQQGDTILLKGGEDDKNIGTVISGWEMNVELETPE
jgi:hypothetical protein